MTKQVQLRRGTSSEHQVFTGAVGELTIDTTLDVAVVHDGLTPGGHYLVGTGFGATVSQGLVNKSFVGIGTTTTNGLQLFVNGNSAFAGNLTLRSLDVIYDPYIYREGTLSDSNLNIIGINTDNIRIGYGVRDNGEGYLANSTIVTSIGVGNIGISPEGFVVGSATTSFLITNPLAGQASFYDLTLSHQAVIAESGITTAYIQDLSVRTGIVTSIGITTASIDLAYINTGIVTTVGISSAYVSDLYLDAGIATSFNAQILGIGSAYIASGIITNLYTTDLDVVTANIDILTATDAFIPTLSAPTAYINSGIVTSIHSSVGYANTSYINVGIITNAYITSAIATDLYTTTLSVQTSYINVGIGTTLAVQTEFVEQIFANTGIITNAYINSGIVTTAGITSARVDNFFATSGIVTTAGISSAYINNLYFDVGIATMFAIATEYANESNINVGIITYAGISTATINQAYINSGIVTTVGITSARVDNFFATSGIVTTAGISSGRVDNLFVASGIVTTAGISSGRVDNLFVASGIVTTLAAENSYLSNLNVNVAITTNAFITTSYTDAQYVNSGFATSYDIVDAYITSGIATDLYTTTLSADTAYINVGIGTTISVTGIGISQVYTNIGFATNLVVSNRVTTPNLNANVGLITNITGTNLNYSGIATISNSTGVGTITIGIGNTALLVDGSARITGVLTIGNSSILLDGTNSNITGVQRLVATSSTITNLVGTNLNYSGISTFNQVGIGATLSLVGFNTVGAQDKTVKIQLSNSGIASDYTLTLPSKLGTAGQLLGLLPDGTLGFNTNGAGLFENRYYVSNQNGNDAYDGKALPVKTLKRAAQLASFDSFQIPGQRYLDAGDLLEANKEFIKEESVAYVQFNYENIGIATIFPDFDANTWKSGISSVVDALTYDTRFGGNSKSREIGIILKDSGTYDGEEDPFIFALDYIKFISQYIVNNQSPPTLYQFPVTQNQTFDFTIVQDPENNNANYFHRSKDARNLIVGNRQEIIDKSLASVALAATTGFYFPGEIESNERSRYYDSYKLIQINRQEIIDYAWNAALDVYPGISATQTKCKRDLGYFVDAVSTDVFTGGNNYVRSFAGFYFDAFGNPITNGLFGEETQSVYAFEQAKVGMSSAICNLLTNKDLTITADPATGSNTSPTSCANVRSTISTLVGIVTSVISAGSTAGIGTTTNYGYFLVNSEFNVRDFVGIGTTNVVGGRKCARDLGYIIDAVAEDVNYGTNQHIIYATKKYFNGAGLARTDGLAGEEVISGYAFTSLGYYAKLAVTNQLNYQDLNILADAGVGTNKGSTTCATTRSTIDSLVGILTTAVLSGSLVGIASTSIGLTDCSDVRSALVNYVGIITTIIGQGTGAAPDLSLPQTKSKPVCIVVEAGEYLEDNPIILYDDVAVVGDNLRNTIIRPLNGGKDLFRVRNGVYLTGFAMKDAVDVAGIPQSTFNYAVAFDDPTDQLVSRAGYATKSDKPTITRSPYIQNCSILSFLGGNGILVDGSKVLSPNTPLITQEAEIPVIGDQPEQGKSMVAAAFTMVSFGGIGWRTINDGYAQVVSCFQIFCRYGSLTQSGGYLSITNSATNFGLFALRSTGFSPNSFLFDRGRIAATGTSGGLTTLKVVGLGRSEQDLYVVRFFNDSNVDVTANFKASPVITEFIGAATTNGGVVDINDNTFNIISHPYNNGDSVVYSGDEGVIPNRVIGGLVNQNQYYVQYINSSSFKLTEDDSLTRVVDLSSASTGIHTFTKNTQEFFAKEVIDRHNQYQSIIIDGTQPLTFVSGRPVQQTVSGGVAVGYAYTWNNTTRQLVVSVELSEGVRRNFAATGGANLTIADHSGTPISTTISATAGITTYWSLETKVDSTLAGGTIQGVSNLPETYKLHFHRPSIINSSSHTWEFSGSGIDYNALPQNGGKTDPRSEQVSERGGRVFSSGTNELGDFKIGDFITAYNRTGNIIFNNTVTIGNLDSIRLSLSGGVAIEEFSTDGDLGDNETGGPLNKRVSTQLAVRTFLNNRLGGFIDKLVSTNAIPNAIVQLNSIGQINPDLIPPKTVNYYRALNVGGKTQLVNLIPTTNLNSGDVVSEPIDSFVLVSDLIGQYLVLNNSTIYNFQNGDEVVSVTSAGGAIGIVTVPTTSGVNTTTLSFPNVGYGTTGLVRGVPLTLKSLSGGSGYTSAGIYTGVRLDTATGIGTGITAVITVSAAGTVSNVAIQTGGFKFATNDVLTLNDPTPIGGRSGGSNFTVQVNTVETRLYLKLTNQQKFPGTSVLPDYISDRNATGVSTNIGIGTTFSFNPTDIGVGGDIDFANDRIVIGAGHTLQDGDPVIYDVTGGTVVTPLLDQVVYYVKRVGLTSVSLYSTYALSTIKDLSGSGTGSHTLTRPGIVTSTDQIVFVNHGFSQGDPVKITNNTPTGVTTGNFYFVGSVTQNSFSLHETRAESLTSINGLLLNTIDLGNATNPVGIMTLTRQNITYTSSVNTSSNDEDNFSLLTSTSLDAANIVTGILNPSRLGSGAANDFTFLSGDSSYKKVVTSVGIGTTQPFDIQGYTSATFPTNGVGITTYYGNVILGLNRVEATNDQFSTLGISRFKTSTFQIVNDGSIEIKNSAAGGDVDAATLGGNNSAYFLDVNNQTGTIPVTRGGTGLTGAPASGALLVGNGTGYTLTASPTLNGTLTSNRIVVAANHDIRFTTGTWTGETAGKIQFTSNSLYLQFTTSLFGRNASGTNVFTLGNTGNAVFSGTITGTFLTVNGTGSATAPAIDLTGGTSRWINFGTTGSATPAFTTRSAGTKLVLNQALSASSVDYALGYTTSSLWFSTGTTSTTFTWYGGTTLAATLTGAGALTLVSSLSATTLTSTIATGTAPLTVTSTTSVNNLRAQYVTSGMLDNNNDSMNFRVIRNSNSASNRDGMYIGYGNANAGDTRLYGGGNTATPVTIGNGGTLTASSTITGTRLISNIATGTAPLTVTSTTLVTNLNADLLDGLNTSSSDTSGNSVVVRSSGAFTTGAVTATTLTLNGGGSTTSPQLTFSGATNNWITFGTNGVAAPAFTTRSLGTKVVYYTGLGGSSVDYAAGIESSTLWHSVPTTSQQFRWYGGTTVSATLTGAGALTLASSLSATTLTSTVATGTAPLTVASTTLVTNLNADLLDGYNSAESGASVVLRTNSSGYIVHQNWINIGSGTGLYAPNGAYFYNDTTYGWFARSNTTSSSSIRLQTSDGTTRGWWYVDTSNNQGFLSTGGSWMLQVTNTGNVTATGTVTASSDIKFKTRISTIENALDKVLQLRGVEYIRKDDPEQNKHLGLIAQEVEKVLPELVYNNISTTPDGVTDEFKTLAYQNMVAVLIEAVKEQQTQINELRDEIKKLKGK